MLKNQQPRRGIASVPVLNEQFLFNASDTGHHACDLTCEIRPREQIVPKLYPYDRTPLSWTLADTRAALFSSASARVHTGAAMLWG